MRFALAILILTIPATAAAAPPDEITAELNAARARVGLPPLVTDPGLCTTCQNWAQHMASVGRMYHGGGEHVVAWGQSSAREVVQDWLNSPGHRAWLFSQNTSCGFGVAMGRDGRLFWAGAFGGGVRQLAADVVTTSFRVASTPTRLVIRERQVIRSRLFGRCR